MRAGCVLRASIGKKKKKKEKKVSGGVCYTLAELKHVIMSLS